MLQREWIGETFGIERELILLQSRGKSGRGMLGRSELHLAMKR